MFSAESMIEISQVAATAAPISPIVQSDLATATQAPANISNATAVIAAAHAKADRISSTIEAVNIINDKLSSDIKHAEELVTKATISQIAQRITSEFEASHVISDKLTEKFDKINQAAEKILGYYYGIRKYCDVKLNDLMISDFVTSKHQDILARTIRKMDKIINHYLSEIYKQVRIQNSSRIFVPEEEIQENAENHHVINYVLTATACINETMKSIIRKIDTADLISFTEELRDAIMNAEADLKMHDEIIEKQNSIVKLLDAKAESKIKNSIDCNNLVSQFIQEQFPGSEICKSTKNPEHNVRDITINGINFNVKSSRLCGEKIPGDGKGKYTMTNIKFNDKTNYQIIVNELNGELFFNCIKVENLKIIASRNGAVHFGNPGKFIATVRSTNKKCKEFVCQDNKVLTCNDLNSLIKNIKLCIQRESSEL